MDGSNVTRTASAWPDLLSCVSWYVGFASQPPVYPASVSMTPGTSRRMSSTPQKQPPARTATSRPEAAAGIRCTLCGSLRSSCMVPPFDGVMPSDVCERRVLGNGRPEPFRPDRVMRLARLHQQRCRGFDESVRTAHEAVGGAAQPLECLAHGRQIDPPGPARPIRSGLARHGHLKPEL